MAFKMTMFFTDPSGVGWTESWYLNTTNPTNAVNAMNAIAGARVGFLDSGFFLSWIRLGQVFPSLASILYAGPGVGQWPGRPLAAPGRMMPNVGVLYFVTSGNLHRRMFTMRGVAPTIFGGAWAADPQNGVVTAVTTTYVQALNNNGAALLFNSTPALKPITALAPDPLMSGMVQVTSPAHGLATGQVITLYKLRSKPSFAGKKKIIVTGANTLLLQGTDVGQVFYQGNGQFRVFTPGYDPTLSFQVKRIATHRSGRPFALLRGRTPRRL